MTITQRLWRFLFPPSRWQGCQPMREAQRLAAYETRLGAERAARRLRGERVDQVIDRYTASKVRPKFRPRLPDAETNVVPIRKRRVK